MRCGWSELRRGLGVEDRSSRQRIARGGCLHILEGDGCSCCTGGDGDGGCFRRKVVLIALAIYKKPSSRNKCNGKDENQGKAHAGTEGPTRVACSRGLHKLIIQRRPLKLGWGLGRLPAAHDL